MKLLKQLFILTVLFSFSSLSLAQVSKDAAVQIEVTISKSPLSLTLHWPSDLNGTGYSVYRRLKGAASWGVAKKLPANSSSYTDSTVILGTPYEYRISKTLKIGTTSITATGYTESGISIPALNDQGKLILLVDKTFSDSLKTELTRLEQDLWNDGWQVIRHDVGRNDKVPDVKAIVANDYNNDPDNTKVLFIFGHVPVPYSGFLNPDGHPDHFGAWPADVYYGEFNSGDWTDTYTDTSSGRRPANHNISGDGKFDYSQIPDVISLMIGRVDLSDMSSFSKNEKELLKQYLDKDHNFRTGVLTAPARALLEDSFGYFGGEAFASSGWRNLAPLVGIDSIKEFNTGSGNWMPVLSTQPFLWAYGCGGGWDNGAGGAGSTGEFAGSGGDAIFMMLFGSYFGDWNTSNNFLRAPLATSYGLSNAWSGRPYWDFFPMGLGEPLGYCARLTQNNGGDFVYNFAAAGVHIALMGDPTLVMHPYVPPTSLSVITDAQYHNSTKLSWLPSSDKNILGYNVYRAKSATGVYELLTPSPISSLTFDDKSPFVDTNAYMVRAIKLETTPSGSYYNLSAGTRSVISGVVKNGVVAENTMKDNLQVMQMVSSIEIILHKNSTSSVKLEIYDASGRVIGTLDDRTLSAGVYRYDWQTSSIGSGVYFVRAIGMREPLTAKFLVMH